MSRAGGAFVALPFITVKLRRRFGFADRKLSAMKILLEDTYLRPSSASIL